MNKDELIIDQKKMKKKIKLRSVKLRSRSASRLAAVQIIYNSLVLHKDINDIVLNYRINFFKDLLDLFELESIDEEYFHLLIKEFKISKDLIFKKIQDKLDQDWTMERIGIVDKSILIVGIIELTIMENISIKTIISEYVELAFQLGGESKFINKILDLSAIDCKR